MEQDTDTRESRPVEHRPPSRKIASPALPSLYVPRDALSARLDEGVEAGAVSLLSAPTGYGKSTLLAAWSAASVHPVAWLTVDELDDDARALWRGVRHTIAAALVSAGLGDTVGLGEIEVPVHEDQTGLAIDDLVSRLDALPLPLVLVLDNVDEIASPGSVAMLDRLVRYAPAHVHLMLSGRFDPPVNWQRVRAAGRLNEIGAQDLRFSVGETRQLAELWGVQLGAKDEQELVRVTEGWPVAVKMTLGAMATAPTAAGARATLRPTSEVADALVTQVLTSLGPRLGEFVLAATTCRSVDAELADALNGGDGGAELLAQCVERGLFLDRQVTGEGEPVTYRWHDAFAAQCQTRLATAHPRRWRVLHRAAAHHWRDKDLDEAVTHALRGGRPGLAATFLHERWIELVLRGEHALLLELCHRVPAPLDESPELLLLMAVCHYLDGDLAQADLMLRRTGASAAGEPGESTRPGQHRFALLEQLLGVVISSGHVDPSVMAALGEELLDSAPPDEDAVVVAGAEHVVGRLLARAGRPAPAAALFEVSTAVATARSMAALRLAGESELSLLVRESQGCGVGRSRARAAVDEGQQLGWGSAPILSAAYLTLALSEYDRDDLDTARDWAIQALGTVQRGDWSQRALTRAALLEIALAAGDPAATQENFDALASMGASRLPPYWPSLAAVLSARRHLARGEVAAASTIVTGLATRSGPGPGLAEHPGSVVWAAEILRRTGAPELAAEVLTLVPPDCQASQLLTRRHLVAALLAVAADERDRAHQLLEAALAAGELDDVRRPFTDRREEILPLLAEHLSWGTEHATFTISLLDHLPAAPVVPALTSHWSLTPREHEVLLYLRTSMTAADIAAAAFVSINTVRTHQRAIYRKLGVEGRRDAVRVATERGLL
ncbi:LuxR C-terminal-related transcriptional regulator [Sanguibacter suarezii]|uniref:LuxR C-terminal-related transcriptional regulator n=1 Tax=Sanguibacter suarezii TaxID=60921 RepID=UPI00082BD2AA|nr:LuxR C-terminal-related transcriptional regulator [Sanguibacter suarezii]